MRITKDKRVTFTYAAYYIVAHWTTCDLEDIRQRKYLVTNIFACGQ